jgi:hypothetical protein
MKLKNQKWATGPNWGQKWGVLFCTPFFNSLGPGKLPLGGLNVIYNFSPACLALMNLRFVVPCIFNHSNKTTN